MFEHDFTGTDMVKEISSGPYGKERFELEFVGCFFSEGSLRLDSDSLMPRPPTPSAEAR